MAETSPALARFRLILWVFVALAAIGATALFVFKPVQNPATTAATRLSVTPTGSFSLQSTKGGTFTEADLSGTPTLLFFGYTSCPNVCPTTLADTVDWRNKLGVGYDRLHTVFVTIDPERDTKELMTSYLEAFDPNIIGLVGTGAETETIKTEFGVTANKVNDDGKGFYLMDHTASVFLIGRNGEFEGTVDDQEDEPSVLAKIKRLVEG